ncbi:MAG TPA: fumarylacetoacetate hydrolase family protein [Paenibacillaceae bacterium]
MKLVAFIDNGREKLGVKTDGGVFDVTGALASHPADGVPGRMHEAIEGGSEAVRALAAYVDRVLSGPGGAAFLREEESLVFAPCVPSPGKIICVGLNYRKHAEETGMPIPDYPVLFSKFSNALAGHRQDVPMPKASSMVDYEVELAVVIGRKAKDVPKDKALEYVFGYCAANDLSARDLQGRTSQWLLGKTCDGFCPIGPYLVTADEVGDPGNLELTCLVNGEVRQHSNTSDMIFPCDELVSYISRHMTLMPGDIILTGTPQGVILGYPEEKRVWLKPGDVITVEVEKLGALTNRLASPE